MSKNRLLLYSEFFFLKKKEERGGLPDSQFNTINNNVCIFCRSSVENIQKYCTYIKKKRVLILRVIIVSFFYFFIV